MKSGTSTVTAALRVFLTAITLALTLAGCGGGGGGITTITASPGALGAIASNSQVKISWSSVSGATSYNLYWSTTSGVTKANGTKIAGVNSSYTQTGLTNGVTYYYVLTAVNSAGESAESPQASAMPAIAAPSSPTIISIVPASTQITLSWSVVSGATSYNLYWSTTSGVTPSNGTKIANITSVNISSIAYTQTGLTNNTPYYYVVTAVNSAGESAASTQQTATPAAPPAGWSAAVNLASFDVTGSLTSYSPEAVSINNTGTAVSLWRLGNGTTSFLYASVYQNGVWGTAVQLGTNGAYMPSVSVTPAGDAVVVYEQDSWDATNTYTTGSVINGTLYNHTSGTWTTPVQVGAGSVANAYEIEPYVVSDSKGNAMAVWSDYQTQVFARRFDATLGAWEATSKQLSSSPRGIYTPKIVVDGNNVFTAVWIEDTGVYDPSLPGGGPNHPTPTVRRYTSAGWDASSVRIGWSPADFPYGNFDYAERPWVGVNAAGDVSVVWEQTRTLANLSPQFSVDTARYDPVAAAWVAPSSIATNTSYLSWPRVAVDSLGNTLTVWTKSDPVTSGTSAQSTSFNKTAGTWSTPITIDQGSGSASDVVMGMDSSGNAEVVWKDNTNGMTERRYDATGGTGWGAFNARTPASYNLVFNMSSTGYAALLGRNQSYGMAIYDNVMSWILTP